MLVYRNIVAVGNSILIGMSMLLLTSGSRLVFFPAVLCGIGASIIAAKVVAGKETPIFESIMLGAPAVFSVGGAMGLLLFLESPATRLIVILSISILHALYFTHQFFFLHVPSRYTPHALESVASLMHAFTVFAVATSTYGLWLFTEFPFILLLLPVAVLLFMILFQSLWIAKVETGRAKMLAAVGTLILIELLSACAFLSTSLYVNGAIIALAAYALHFLFRVEPTDPHFLRTARRAALLASSLLVVLVSTAPWR